MLIHGSELVAVAQGLVEYWDSRWIFSALASTIRSQKSEHVLRCAFVRRTRQVRPPFVGVAKARAASGLQKSGGHTPRHYPTP